ncbi:MAG: leucyl aminopeptidase [Acidobacteria bacterium]|nr:leucyl aminopeptidase [Acidobacteriota bacterium]
MIKTRVEVTRRGLGQSTADAWLLFVLDDLKLPRGVPAALVEELRAEMARRQFRGGRGETLVLPFGPRGGRRTVVLAGLGRARDAGAERVRLAAAAGARQARAARARRLSIVPPELGDDAGRVLQGVAEGALLGGYRFDRYLTDPARRGEPVERVTLHVADEAAARRALQRARAVAAATALARDLVNEPAGALTPASFAAQARRHARAAGLAATVLGPAELERERMLTMLAVGQGSANTPRLVHLRYRPRRRSRMRLVLVGKGVTFDSGGYDIKGAESMAHMKSDMAGAAAVLGAMVALAELRPAAEVHGIAALVENLVSSRAYKPGDILTTRRGKTVEINNTDAEGRLVLADALDYARSEIKPDIVVDLATLTGACVVALGPLCSGVMANNEELSDKLLAAARAAGEKMWPLPLFDEYAEQLRSDVADMRNTGERYGGALTAGLFLREFVDAKVPWAHLDIAGPAFLEKEHPHWGKGGTGAGVATLVEFALSL